MNLNYYKQQSIDEGIVAGDIAYTDEIISSVIDQKQIDSLSYQICELFPIHGPTGAHFSTQYDKVNNKTKLVRTEITVEDDAVIDTGFTLESIQDMQSQFGKDSTDFISKAFAGLSAINENDKLISKIDTWAFDDTNDLVLSNPTNAETNVFELSQKVGECIIKMNSKNYRTFDAFVILPHKLAASVLSIGSYFNDDINKTGLYMGKSGRIKYYVNPDATSTEVYVGLNGKIPGSSSIIFSPYQHSLLTAVSPDSGNENIFNVNRYAITLNSLSTVGNEMLIKFTVA
jgi:hypothetical protein